MSPDTRISWSTLLLFLAPLLGFGQCDPTVPTLAVDLSASPSATWISPPMQRQDNCCGTTAPDRCIRFIVTLHPQAQGILFNICAGAVPPGALYYQINCGPATAVGAPICLNGPGPHELTFCKPGNNSNQYCISSIPAPSAGPDIAVNEGCTGQITSSGFAPGTVQWNSVFPGPTATYNTYLSCSTCASTNVNGQPGYPPYVDYQVCGQAISPCTGAFYCDTVRVYFNSTLTAGIAPTNPTICFGAGNAIIVAGGGGGTPPYSFLWSTGATTAAISVGPGTYTVQVSDTSQCPPATAIISVTQFIMPIQALAGADITSCDGSGVNLNGVVSGAPGGQWITGAGQFLPGNTGLNATYVPTASELATGHVDLVLATTGNGTCPGDLDTVRVWFSGQFAQPLLSATDVLCAGGSTGSISVSPIQSGGTYQWNDPMVQSGPLATGLPAGTYTVTITDALGCDTAITAIVSEPPPLQVNGPVLTPVTCAGLNNGTATFQVTGGTPPLAMQWSTGAIGPVLTAGAGTYTFTTMDANGCSIQGSATVTAPAPLTLTAVVPDTVCENAPVVLVAQTSGGTQPYGINWSGIGVGSPLTHSFSTSQTVQVTVTDAAGCQGPTLSMPVVVLDLSTAVLTATGDTSVCPGGSATLGATLTGYNAAVIWSWPQLGYQQPGPITLPVTQSGTYAVQVINVCGQTLIDSVEIVLETPPALQLPALIAEGCAPLNVQFTDMGLAGPLAYLWNFGDGTTSAQPAPMHTYAVGTFSVSLTVSTPAGCTATSPTSGLVIVHPPPTAAFTASPWITDIDHPTVSFTDQSTPNAVLWNWSFGDGGQSTAQHPLHQFDSIGVHTVTLVVQDGNGCEAQVSQTVVVTPVYDVTIPNAFSPAGGAGGGNWIPGDLSNDVFYPFVRFVKEFRMRIYNRWGELIFETDDVARGWDGRYRDQLSPQDAYVYQVWVRFVDDHVVERLGDVTLFR
ncbi:MAG: PKD domain-containing protein [Flavobacteriales bacterium]|nr:PKD domain-containing protein [Flavobacteriales bacterium]